MNRKNIGAVIGAVTFTGAILLAAAAAGQDPSSATPTNTPRADVACEQEDSTACLWDAATRGNGLGTPVYSDAAGRQFFLAPEPAAFADLKRAEGWTRWDRPVDGHRNCWAIVGPTTFFHCRDGFATTS